MAGLSDYLTDQQITTEAMPSWFSTAQQKLVTDVGKAVPVQQAATTAPAAQAAFGAAGPFATGQNILETVGSGAANPWIVSTDATGKQTVAPNMATPLGGLFGAQQQYLNQILPDIEAAETAKYIGGGGFGSRMNLSAAERARAAAASDLFQKQMSSALQAQQTAAQAGSGLGQLGAQQAQEAIDTATFLQSYPYADLVNMANIYKTIAPSAGKSTVQKAQMSLPSQLGALSTIFGGGQQGLQGLAGNLSDFFNWAGKKLGTTTGGTVPGSTDIAGTSGTGYDPYADYGYTFIPYGTSEGE